MKGHKFFFVVSIVHMRSVTLRKGERIHHEEQLCSAVYYNFIHYLLTICTLSKRYAYAVVHFAFVDLFTFIVLPPGKGSTSDNCTL